MSATCSSCGRPIEWAVTAKAGAKIPLDPEPANGVVSAEHRSGRVGLVPEPDRHARTRAGALIGPGAPANYGNLEVIGRNLEGAPIVRVVPLAERPYCYRLRLSHFATCPNAEEHRRRSMPPPRDVERRQ